MTLASGKKGRRWVNMQHAFKRLGQKSLCRSSGDSGGQGWTEEDIARRRRTKEERGQSRTEEDREGQRRTREDRGG